MSTELISNNYTQAMSQDETMQDGTHRSFVTKERALTAQVAPGVIEDGRIKNEDFDLHVTSSVHDAEIGGFAPPDLSPSSVGLEMKDSTLLMEYLLNKITPTQLRNNCNQIDQLTMGLRSRSKDAEKSIRENAVKHDELLAKQKQRMIGGLIGKIFGAIAAVFLAMFTGGAGLGLAAGLAAYSVVDATLTAVNVGLSLSGKKPIPGLDQPLGKLFSVILEACGVDHDKADEVGGYLAIATTVLFAIATIAVTWGANVASVVNMLPRAVRMAQTLTGLAQGATQVAQGATSIQIGLLQRDIANIQADLSENTAERDVMQKLLVAVQDATNEIIKNMGDAQKKFSEIVKSSDESSRGAIRNMA